MPRPGRMSIHVREETRCSASEFAKLVAGVTVRSESPAPTRPVSELVARVREDHDLAELVKEIVGSVDTPEPTAEELEEVNRWLLEAEEVKLLLVGRT